MGMYRVMFVGHGPSGLPEDRVVNTFHFDTGASGQDLNDCILAVVDFYTLVAGAPAPANKLGEFLSPWVQRDVECRGYTMTDTPPRFPTIFPFSLPASLSPSGLPEEVALCVSYSNTPPPAVTPRTRGRLYIGPLNVNCITNATSTDPSRPGSNFMLVLADKAKALADSPVGWAVHSTVAGGYTQITEGWIDNAFDTQRRRGPEATARTPWGP